VVIHVNLQYGDGNNITMYQLDILATLSTFLDLSENNVSPNLEPVSCGLVVYACDKLISGVSFLLSSNSSSLILETLNAFISQDH
jgi:hypothetical protein